MQAYINLKEATAVLGWWAACMMAPFFVVFRKTDLNSDESIEGVWGHRSL